MADITLGTPVTFGDSAQYTETVYDSINDKFVVFYSSSAGAVYLTAVVGTVESGVITFGTPVDVCWTTANGPARVVFDESSGRVVLTYTSNTGEAGGNTRTAVRTGVVTGTSIAFDEPLYLNEDFEGYVQDIAIDRSTGTIVIAAAIAADSGTYTHFWAGSVSGGSLSLGAMADGPSGHTFSKKSRVAAGNGKVAVTLDEGPTVLVGSVSGTSVSIGAAVDISSLTDRLSRVPVVYDERTDRFVFCAPYWGHTWVGEASASSITFGTPVVHDPSGYSEFAALLYDTNTGKIVIAFDANYDDAELRVGVVDPSDNSITYGVDVTLIYSDRFENSSIASVKDFFVVSYVQPNPSYLDYSVAGLVDGSILPPSEFWTNFHNQREV